MKILRCNEITEEPCDYVAEGDEPQYAKEDMMRHIKEDHDDLWRQTPPSEKIRIEEAIDDTLAEADDVDIHE